MADVEPEVGPTTAQELEGGMFNMLVALVQLHISNGNSRNQTYLAVADILDGYARGLRQLIKGEEQF